MTSLFYKRIGLVALSFLCVFGMMTPSVFASQETEAELWQMIKRLQAQVEGRSYIVENAGMGVTAYGDRGVFEIYFTIEAIAATGDDVWIPEVAERSIGYQILNGKESPVYGGAMSAVLKSSAQLDGDSYRVRKGTREQFRLEVTYTPEFTDSYTAIIKTVKPKGQPAISLPDIDPARKVQYIDIKGSRGNQSGNTNSETIEQLKKQIAQLMEMLVKLQGGGGSQSPVPNSHQCPTENIRFGDRDFHTQGQVSKLQSFLADRYSLNRADYVTGYFGRSTRNFLTRFQTEQGLSPTGWADETTLARINAWAGCGGVYEESKKQTLKIKAPQDGAVFVTGQSILVQWESSNLISNSGIITIDGGKDGSKPQRHYPENANSGGRVDLNKGSYLFTLPIQDRFGELEAGTYTLTVWMTDVKEDQSAQDSIQIVIVTNSNKREPSVKTVLPKNGSGAFEIGDSIPMQWDYKNIPANSQIIANLELLKALESKSGVTGGTWQSQAISGSGSLTYPSGGWSTGAGRLEVAGTYRLSTFVRQCNPKGCNYYYPENESLPVITKGSSVEFTIQPAYTETATEKSQTCSPNFTLRSVYGTGIYTDDSDVCTAALHAGVVNRSVGGLVKYKMISGQSSYTPTTKNGVTSRSWGAWTGSFQFTSPEVPPTPCSGGLGCTPPVPDPVPVM